MTTPTHSPSVPSLDEIQRALTFIVDAPLDQPLTEELIAQAGNVDDVLRRLRDLLQSGAYALISRVELEKLRKG